MLRYRFWLGMTFSVTALWGMSGQAQEDGTRKLVSEPVTSQMLLDGFKDPTKWLMYSGDYTSKRHSPLTEITPKNVNRLTPQWTFRTETPAPGRGFETSPLVLDGVMYVTGINNHAWAVDARTGRELWHYERTLPEVVRLCCGRVNRGFGALGDRLYMGTLDAHLVALDRKTGKVVWDITVEEPNNGYSITAPPMIIKNKVIIGASGGDFATRGFIDAYDAVTGKRLWRFYTVPGESEPGSDSWPNAEVMRRGGGAVWTSGAYDPAQNMVFFGTGNPNPSYYGNDREGDNLYTCSLVALDADTGTLKWHYQFTPHDVHDWDSAQIPVLGDLTIAGKPRKVVFFANRNGFFYVLDRTDGEVIFAKPFTSTARNWAREIGGDGKPIVLDNVGTPSKCLPDQRGGTNFQPPSFDPVRRLYFITAHETCATWVAFKPSSPITLGRPVPSGGARLVPDKEQWGAFRALDPATGEIKWEHRFRSYPSNVTLDLSGGATSTASGVVFTGDNDGDLYAFESATGEELWRFHTGGAIWGAPPVTFMLEGHQWIVVPAGLNLTAFKLPESH
jgi:alcohol dehydrogenase (cytochrome c)